MYLRIPDHIRYVDVFGVLYYIRWEDLLPGHSFFIKTTAAARVVKRSIRPAETFLRVTLRAHPRCEFGYYGVRVWRVA
jgi:hypothetical protein